ncbi:MAG: cytidine deaminase [Gammaproteobacteria bacterium]|nr:cytidine deaminase [Gammaproteobacteria bacterium]
MEIDIEALYQLALQAFNNAYSPYSKFKVGASILSNGQMYKGCNIENAAYPMSQCAEATAIGNMVTSGHNKIEAVLIVSDTPDNIWPCGGCLQKISEFCLPSTVVISSTLDGKRQQVKFSELYPQQFNSKDLRA